MPGNWQNLNVSVPLAIQFTHVSVSGTRMVASFVGVSTTGIYYSNDGGATWTQSDAPNLYRWSQVAISGSNAVAIYDSIYPLDNSPYINESGIYYSTNGGQNWTATIARQSISNQLKGSTYDLVNQSGSPSIVTLIQPDISIETFIFTNISIDGNDAVVTYVYTAQGQSIGFSGIAYTSNLVNWTIPTTMINNSYINPGNHFCNALGWENIALSGTTALVNAQSKMYISTNNLTWTFTNNNYVGNVSGSLTLSGNGNNAIALSGQQIFYSSNPFNNWTPSTGLPPFTIPPIQFNSVSMSGTNAVASYGPIPAIIYSNNSGASWTNSNVDPDLEISNVSMSGNTVIATCKPLGNICKSTTSGTTWNLLQVIDQTTTSLPWTQVCASGTNAIAFLDNGFIDDSGAIYYSKNSGDTWFLSDFPISVTINCISISGNNAVASYILTNNNTGGIYYSKNGGQNWVLSNENFWASRIAISGENVVMDYNNYNDPNGIIYYSTNGGKDWLRSIIDLTSQNTVNDISLSGKYGIATINKGINNNGGVYYSENGGKNWYQSDSLNEPGYNWGKCSISGARAVAQLFYIDEVVVTNSFNEIHYSNNYGISGWTKSNAPINKIWASVSISGEYAFATSTPLSTLGITLTGSIYESVDGGATWSLSNNDDLFWNSVSVTDPYALACVFGGGIYKDKNLISNICFVAGTLILLDQGEIPIEKIDPRHHTMRGKKIIAITKTRTNDDSLVCFEKDALGPHYPKKKTIVSLHHLIEYQGQLLSAKSFVDNDKVKRIPYNNEPLYNVLLKKYEIMVANGLRTETLHPENPIAKTYMKKSNVMTLKHKI